MKKKLFPIQPGVCLNLLLRRPILAIFDVTRLCNQNCPMCNIHRSTSAQMPLSQIRQNAEVFRKKGVGYVFLQGGEPLLRKDIIEIADIFIENGIKPTIITNGILLTPETAAEIAKRDCNLAVSIDSLIPEKYRYMRGADTLECVLRNLDKIKDMEHKGNWSVTTTVSAMSSFEDVKNISDYAAKNHFMFAVRPYIATTGTAGKYDEKLDLSQNNAVGIFEYFKKKAEKDNYLASLVYGEHIRYLRGEPMPPCDALKYSFLLKETGEKACCIEKPELLFEWDKIGQYKKKYQNEIVKCNKETPCFYNDAREIGILFRNRRKILLHLPGIISQMRKYKNFF